MKTDGRNGWDGEGGKLGWKERCERSEEHFAENVTKVFEVHLQIGQNEAGCAVITGEGRLKSED